MTPPSGERLNKRAAGVIGMAVMASRILGLAREQIFAALFGAGRSMDAFIAAFRIPNLLRDLFAEGALSTAFVTTFTRTIATGGDEAAWRLANKVATMTLVVLSSICVLGIIFSPQLVAAMTPGFAPSKAELTVTLTRIMFPFILMVSVAALVMGMLNSKGQFGVPAMASSFFNIGSIIGGVALGYWIDPHFGARSLVGVAIGTLIGGAMQLGVQLPLLAKQGYRFRLDFQWRDPGVRSILLLMGPSVIAASTTQVNVMVNAVFASHLGDGPMSWLSIAFRLMQLPLGLFGVALGTVTLPLLSRLAVKGEMLGFRQELSHGIRLAFLLTLPAAIGLVMLAEPIISVLYQHGKFGVHETIEAAGALQFYAIGLSAYAALKVLVNAFYALDMRRVPMYVSFMAVSLNLLFNWVFTFHLGWGHRGLALSTGLVAISNFLVLFLLMRRRLDGMESRLLLTTLLKVTVAGVALGLVCLASNHWLLGDWPTAALASKVLWLGLTVIAGAAAFWGTGLVLGIPELQEVYAAMRRRVLARVGRDQ